jgi:hypothetical protein
MLSNQTSLNSANQAVKQTFQELGPGGDAVDAAPGAASLRSLARCSPLHPASLSATGPHHPRASPGLCRTVASPGASPVIRIVIWQRLSGGSVVMAA